MKEMLALILSINLSCLAKTPKKFEPNQGSRQDIVELIKSYAKKYNEPILIDPGVQGSIHVLVKAKSQQEEFYILAHALTLNGYTFVQKKPFWIVRPSRNAQRDQIPVYINELPPLQPEVLITYIRSFKKRKSSQLVKDIRVFTSRDGELSYDPESNKLLITDYSSNILRVGKILDELEK